MNFLNHDLILGYLQRIQGVLKLTKLMISINPNHFACAVTKIGLYQLRMI
jgi:hypothetical protein